MPTRMFAPRMHATICRLLHRLLILVAAVFIRAELACAAESALFARGYTVVPAPQKVTLRERDFQVDAGWRLLLGKGVSPNDIAVEALRQDLNPDYS